MLTLSGHTDALRRHSIAFSPDGKRIATAGEDRTAKIWDLASAKDLYTLSGHTNLLTGVAFNPDGTRLATSSFDGTTKVWDALSGRQLLTLTNP